MTEPQPRCATCRTPTDTETQACTACIGTTRSNLYAIEIAHRMLRPLLILEAIGSNFPHGERTGGSRERGMPGGNRLVMLAGGSDASNYGTARTGDATSIAFELGRYVQDWSAFHGDPITTAGSVPYAVHYLIHHLEWAAREHPAFPDFVREIELLRTQIERATGTDDTPQRAAARCLDCNGALEKPYRPRSGKKSQTKWGLDDDWKCSRCGRKYTQAAYLLAVRAHLERRKKAKLDAEQRAAEQAAEDA